MAVYKYPQEVKDFITENVKGTRVKDLVELTNKAMGTEFTVSKMRSFMTNHGLKNGLSPGIDKGSPTNRYPQKVRDFIKANLKGNGPKAMQELVNKELRTSYTHSQIKGYYSRNKLNSGETGYFDKGQEPWNKGKTGYMGANRTSFKKGHRPHNYKPVGSERVNSEGYVDIKIADPNKWKPKHHIIWEEVNGPIPEGLVVLFGDGDKQNFNLDNLILVSRAQLAMLNKHKLIHNDADLTKTGVIIADLQLKIGERRKK